MNARSLAFTIACAAAATALACGQKNESEPPVATASFAVNHQRAALGSPLEMNYRFVVAADAPKFTENYRVLVHFMDADDELMWTDDHEPSVPTIGWKPGQTIEYTRTMFVPVYPYIGEASVYMGLYSASTSRRLPLTGGDEAGQRAYKVGTIQLLPQTDNVFLIFKDGWHPAEVSENSAAIEWQWTKKDATLSFRNPKRKSLFYLHLDSPGGVEHDPQTVTVQLGGQAVDTFKISPKQEMMRKIPLSVEQLGTGDMVELRIQVDKTFVPALLPAANSRDPRELGVRVFHAFVEPQ